MKFPYLVKHDGVYYPAGTDVPIETTPTALSVGEVSREVEKKYSEDDLNVPFQTLKKMCKENGIKFSNKDGSDVLREKLRAI